MTCRCTLHNRRDHADACRLCASQHPAVRLARSGQNGSLPIHRELTTEYDVPSPVRSGRSEGPRDLTIVSAAVHEDARPVGPSPDPALRYETEHPSALGSHAGSPSQGRSLEPVAPLSGSAPALSGSRSTAGGGNE